MGGAAYAVNECHWIPALLAYTFTSLPPDLLRAVGAGRLSTDSICRVIVRTGISARSTPPKNFHSLIKLLTALSQHLNCKEPSIRHTVLLVASRDPGLDAHLKNLVSPEDYALELMYIFTFLDSRDVL